MNWKGSGRKRLGLMKALSWDFAGGTETNRLKFVKIRTEHLQNTSQERYRNTNPTYPIIKLYNMDNIISTFNL
jgi:hypothetical protein